MKGCCGDCKWWSGGLRDDDGCLSQSTSGWGTCRIRAPRSQSNINREDFPMAHEADWCGEIQKERRA